MIMDMVEKAAIQAAITCAATCLYFGMDQLGYVPYVGETKLCYIAAGVGGATSVANDLVHSYVLEEIPINKKAEEEAAMVVGAGAGAFNNVSLWIIFSKS